VTPVLSLVAAIVFSTTAADSLDIELVIEDDVPTYYASEVVVTSDRPVRFEAFSAEVRQIEGEPIRELEWTPHVPVSNYGTTAYPSVRGLPVEHVAMEYDGVPLNSVQNGTFDLPLLGILGTRGTVMRGPFSRLEVGTPAQAAVSLRTPIRFGLAISGAVGTYENAYRIGYGGKDYSWKFGVLSRDPYMESTSSIGWGGEFRYANPFVNASLTAVDMDRGVPGPQYNAAFAGSMEDRLRILRFGLPNLGSAEATFYWTYWRQHFEDSFQSPTHRTYSTGAIAKYDFAEAGLPGADITASFDYSQLDSSDPENADLGVHSRGSGTAVASWVGEAGLFKLAAEAAGEHTSDFGGALSGALGAAYEQEIWSAWLSIGSSYRAPTMNELYWPEDPWTAGNPELDPERVVIAETGARMSSGPWSAAITYYSSKATDLIVWESGDDFIWRPSNQDEVDLSGWEIDLSADFGVFAVGYSGDFATAENVNTGLTPPYRPEEQSYLWWRCRWGRVRVEAGVRSVSAVWIDGANTETLPSYTVAAAMVSAPLPWQGMSLDVGVRNLLNAHYETRAGYPLPGQEWVVGVRFEAVSVAPRQ
jgi:hypothetical protein